MEKYDVMFELQKAMVEQLKKSGLAMTLLCIGFGGMWGLYTGDKKAMKEKCVFHVSVFIVRCEC